MAKLKNINRLPEMDTWIKEDIKAYMKKYFGSQVPSGSYLLASAIGSGTVTLSQPVTNFDMIAVMLGNDSQNSVVVRYYPTWTLRWAQSIVADGRNVIIADTFECYWMVNENNLLTVNYAGTENSTLMRIYGINFD